MDSQSITKAAIEACEPHTRYELAKRLGTKWENVNRWAKGERAPRAKYLLKMLEMAQRAGKTLALLLTAAAILGGGMQPTDALASPAKSLIQCGNTVYYVKLTMRRLSATIRAIFTHAINWLLPFPPIKE
jgi:hypothetical protein